MKQQKYLKLRALSFAVSLAFASNAFSQDTDEDLLLNPDRGDKLSSPSLIQNKLVNFDSKRRIPGQYIVVMKESSFAVDAKGALLNKSLGHNMAAAVEQQAFNLTSLYSGDVKQQYTAALQGFVVTNIEESQIKRMAAHPMVDFIEADTTVSINVTQNNPVWGLDRSDERSLPMDSKYVYGSTAGNGVNIYVIDTGVRRSHNQFGGRARNGFTSINDGRGSSDCNGHGTHVAGTAAGSSYGIAKRARIYSVRVLGCNGSGSNSGVIAGIDWVANNRVKPAVANMSLGGGFSSATNSAVRRAHNRGVTMVVAAGNDNGNACNKSPASEPRAITVASTQSNDRRSSFSNYGNCVDIFAPGSSIRSAWYTSNSATNTISGTSMASPHVAGAAAVYLGRNRNASPTAVTNWLINRSSKNKVINARSGSPNRLLYLRY